MFKRLLIKTLKKTINNLEDDLDLAKSKIQNRDELIAQNQKEIETLLDNSKELRAKIVDLENNIELLTYNIPELNKELVSEHQSQN